MRYLFLVAIVLESIRCEAKVIEVAPNGRITTIAEAVNSARNGDTIYIRKAIYKVNNVVITKSVTIIGEDYPVLDGEGKYQIFYIDGSGIVIKKIHFRNSGYSSITDIAAVKIINSRNIILEENRFTHNYFGIHVSSSDHFVIRNNNEQGITQTEQTTGNGIHLWKCSNALIERNYLTGNRDGIYFEFVTNSRIIGNISVRNIRYGLHFMFSNDDVYAFNR